MLRSACMAHDLRQMSDKEAILRTLEEKIGQRLVVGFEGLTPPDYILDWLAQGRIGGVILFSRNIATPEQVAALTYACHHAARRPILIAIDQEGGAVARLRAGFTESPGGMALGAADSTALTEQVSAVLARELRALGINWNLAPMVDVTHDTANPSVGTRSFGSDGEMVSEFATAAIRGFQSESVAACAKHFPGLGNTPVDTHEALAVISGSVDYLWQQDLIPFRAAVLAGVQSVMVSHVKFESLDPEYPATLSPHIIQHLLREKIGFEGVACTDCMEMRAIADHYGPGESAVLAALAGNDILFFSHTRAYQEAAYDALLTAANSGRLSPENIDTASDRLDTLCQQIAPPAKAELSLIRQPEHVALVEQAARAAVVLLRSEGHVLPIESDDPRRISVIEFASYLDSAVMETGGQTGFIAELHKAAPMLDSVSLRAVEDDQTRIDEAFTHAGNAEIVVLVTRNAHLIEEEAALARQIAARAGRLILVCLRNPYDATLFPQAEVILCSCGDSQPSLVAVIEALMGVFKPSGKLPVPLDLSSL